MISYAIHVISQISVERWGVLMVLLVASIGGYRCCSHFVKTGIWPSTGRKRGVDYGVVVYTALILWFTIILRIPGTTHQANLLPLWSWYHGFWLGNDEIRWQIYFNILLFVPFGFFLYLSKARALGRNIRRGFLLTLFIEVCQYIFCLGLFEWDDLLHNTLGCALGCLCAAMVQRVWSKVR